MSLKRSDGTGLDTLATSREWVQMFDQEKQMIMWYQGVSLEVASNFNIGKELADEWTEWQSGIMPRKIKLQRAQPIRVGQALCTINNW